MERDAWIFLIFFISGILICFSFIGAFVFILLKKIKEENHSCSYIKNDIADSINRDNISYKTESHFRELERIAKERLDIERTDFIVSNMGRNRNIKE